MRDNMNSKKAKSNSNAPNNHDSANVEKPLDSSRLTMDEFASGVALRAAAQLRLIVESVVDNPATPLPVVLNALQETSKLIADQLHNLTPVPKPAPYLFKDRFPSEKHILATDFVKKHFKPAYGISLCTHHIREFDPYLMDRLVREKKQNGGSWPEGFVLPTKEAHTDSQISQLRSHQIKEIERLASDIRNRRKKDRLKTLTDETNTKYTE